MPENIDGINDKPSSKIEKAKKQLYSKYTEIKERPRAHIHEHKEEVSHEWQHSDAGKSKGPSFAAGVPLFRKLFIGAAIFFLAAALIAAASLFGGKNVIKTEDISIEILTKSFVDGGEEFDVAVEVTNKNNAVLELADLILEYPKSSVADGEMVRDRRSLNTIRPGQTIVEDFTATLFGEEGEERTLHATLEYRVQGSNAIFVKESDMLVAVRSTPVQLIFDAPESVINNQEMMLDIDVQSNATSVTENMLMRIEYPSGFKFTEAEPLPSLGNNIWILGDLPPGATRNIIVRGTMRGQSGEERTFRAFVGEQDPKDEKELVTAFNSAVHVVAITTPFIGANLTLNGSDAEKVAINNGETVDGEIFWSNTLPVQLTDVEVVASFSGNAYDSNNVDGNRGFFSSVNDEISWDKTNFQTLGTVQPGEEGTLSFSFIPKALVSGNSVLDKPEINIDINVRGIDPTGKVQSATGINGKVAVVNSDFQLNPKTLFYSGPFSNSGTYPPKVGVQSTMTIAWTVTNSSNAIENATVKTTLPNYVEWLNVISPNTEDITYNSVKREITWDLGRVERGAGFSGSARTVFFKIAITPSVSQGSQIPNLTTDVILSGDDLFTGSFLRSIRRSHTTKLLNDIQAGDGRITE